MADEVSDSSELKPFANYREYRERVEGRLPEWACRYEERSRPWPKRQHYDRRLGYRTEFQMDRDDILYSPSFRQLAYKRQMFSDPAVESFYTRLTHTLIVSQIARSIARGLQLDEHLVEAIALAHDLGHTPYGHSGEDGINRFLDRRLFPKLTEDLGREAVGALTIGDRVRQEEELVSTPSGNGGVQPPMFRHSAEPPSADDLEKLFYCTPSDKRIFSHGRQSYRLLRYLEKGGRGLGLTLHTYYGVLRASASERDDDDFELRFEGINTDFASFEAQVVRIADDIAWANHDLTEDCRKTGRPAEALLRQYFDTTGASALNVHYDDMAEFLHAGPGERYGRFVTDVIESNKHHLTKEGFRRGDAGEPGYAIGPSDTMSKFLEDMKRIVIRTIHESPEVREISGPSAGQIEKLCEFFAEPENLKDIPSELYRRRSPDHLTVLELLRAVVDYVAFMTDSQADGLYQKRLGPHRAPSPPRQPTSKEPWPLG